MIARLGSDHIMESPTTLAPGSISSPSTQKHINPPPSSPAPMPLIPTPLNTTRRTRPSKVASGGIIKRSASSPNIRGLATAEMAMSLAEKRRNKLGYHRTSVACVHCRRRKIRCLLAPNDPQNRCSNCIRLKKECNFFPVDQQPAIERRPRTGSRAEGISDANSMSSSSSPGGVPVGPGIEQLDQFSHYPILPMTSHIYTGSIAPMSAGIISPPSSTGPSSTRAFEFPRQHDRPNWESHLNEHGPLSSGHSYAEDHMNGHWRGSPITPVYSPYTTGPSNLLVSSARDVGSTFPPFGVPRHESGWAAPTRSMSISHLEDFTHHPLNTYHQPYQLDLRRRASEMHPPPSLQTSNNSSNASTSDMPIPPMSTPVSSQGMHLQGLPGNWSSIPAQSPMNKLPEYGGWYTEQGQLARVQEEDVAPHYGAEPPTLYSSAGHR